MEATRERGQKLSNPDRIVMRILDHVTDLVDPVAIRRKKTCSRSGRVEYLS
jgi:hypothetical protein